MLDSAPRQVTLALPWPARAANRTGAFFRGLGLELAEFDSAKLRAEAAAFAGSDDFGDATFEPGLAAVIASAERDAGLSLIGRLGMREAIVNALANRLLRVRARRTTPEAFAPKLVPPLIVMGLPRSGTTLLHRLLALAPRARPLRYWELRRPLPAPGTDDRLSWAKRQQRTFKWLARGLDAKHFSGPEAPEECLFLFDGSFVSVTFWVAAPTYGYLDFYLAADQFGPYRTYREYLELFQAQTPEQRLTLKAPIHAAHVPALRVAVPEAHLIQLHRDPRPALASANSLFATLHRVVTDSLELPRLGHANLRFFATGIDRLLAARRTLPEDAIHDVYYDDLVGDPVGTVRRIHERFGLPFDAAYEARLRAFIRDNPQHKHGQHRYAAEDFGLSDDMVLARFRDYVARFPRVLADAKK